METGSLALLPLVLPARLVGLQNLDQGCFGLPLRLCSMLLAFLLILKVARFPAPDCCTDWGWCFQ